jgi:hypothetical protein
MMMSNLARVPRAEAADHAELSGSLRAAARLVALVADQVDAAGQGRAGWVAWLDEQRDVLRREVFVAGCDAGDAGPLPEVAAGIARLIDQADGILDAPSASRQHPSGGASGEHAPLNTTWGGRRNRRPHRGRRSDP